MIYNKDYGFYKDIRLCIPYLRKDEPSIGSNFSNILLRLILTFKVYINIFKFNLQNEDLNNVLKDNILIKKINLFEKHEYIEYMDKKENNIKIDLIKEYIKNIYIKKSDEQKKEIIIKYLYEINIEKLKLTTSQINLSFQDIIYNTYKQFQVGYTGTIYMNLNSYDSSEDYVFRDKIEDYDEKIEIKLALNRYGSEPSEQKKITIIDKSAYIGLNLITILDKIKSNPRGIVDLAGLFIDYENENIAHQIKEILKDKKIIYLTTNHEIKEYISETESKKFSGVN
jgi:Fe-S cluster assembly scaffold protein SufB